MARSPTGNTELPPRDVGPLGDADGASQRLGDSTGGETSWVMEAVPGEARLTTWRELTVVAKGAHARGDPGVGDLQASVGAVAGTMLGTEATPAIWTACGGEMTALQLPRDGEPGLHQGLPTCNIAMLLLDIPLMPRPHHLVWLLPLGETARGPYHPPPVVNAWRAPMAEICGGL